MSFIEVDPKHNPEKHGLNTSEQSADMEVYPMDDTLESWLRPPEQGADLTGEIGEKIRDYYVDNKKGSPRKREVLLHCNELCLAQLYYDQDKSNTKWIDELTSALDVINDGRRDEVYEREYQKFQTFEDDVARIVSTETSTPYDYVRKNYAPRFMAGIGKEVLKQEFREKVGAIIFKYQPSENTAQQ